MKTIVKRSEWLRGRDAFDNGSMLLRRDGKKCCLGFRALQSGMTPPQISGVEHPPELQAWLDGDCDLHPAHWMRSAEYINDNTALDDAEREAELARIFRAAGEEIEFVD